MLRILGLFIVLLSFLQLNAQVLSEGFEGATFPPTNWTEEYVSATASWSSNAGNNNSIGSANGGSLNAIFASSNYNGDATKLITPSMNLAGGGAYELRFWHSQEDWFGDQDELRVYYKTSAAGAWVLLNSYTNSITAWTEQVISLPSLSNDYYIAFEGTSGWGYGVTLDDVTVAVPPSCATPSALAATNITATSANLDWTENGTAITWELESGPFNFALGTGTNVVTTTKPYALAGLAAQTDYQFYVRAICGVGDTSAWSAPNTFTTACAVITPTYLEDFTTFLPTCWETATGALTASSSLTYGTNDWDDGGFAGLGFTGSATINIYSSHDDWLISPSIDLGAGVSKYQLDFDAALTPWASIGLTTFDGDDAVNLIISTDNGVTWSNANTLLTLESGTEPSGTGDHYAIDLSAYTGVVKFAFHATSTSFGADNDFYVDNFEVKPLCINTSTSTATACGGYIWNGTVYSISGIYTETLTNAAGCDSIATLDLTINAPSASVDTVVACDSFVWIDGLTYTSSNSTATDTFTNVLGCDSVVTLNLTINNSTLSVDTVVACDTFVWIDGTTYTSSNFTATDTLTSISGCDSVIVLNLTILNATTGVDVVVACDSFTWIDSVTYYTDNTTATYMLSNVAGCDSAVTLNLTIGTATSGIDVIEACQSYTWVDGNTYITDNNTATFALLNANGCDSVVTLNLTIKPSVGVNVFATACNSYTWNGVAYTTTGAYADTLTAANGCDSIVTLVLTVNSVDTAITVSNNGGTLTAPASATGYQWINCATNAAINGANAQSFSPSVSGSYAVVVNNLACSDTSSCYTVSNVLSGTAPVAATAVRIFPNPTSGNTMVDLGRNYEAVEVIVRNTLGQVVFTQTLTEATQVPVTVSATSGLYLIEVRTNQELLGTFKLIKE